VQIVPTLLTAEKKIAKEKLTLYKGIFEWVQLDIMDGIFVDNKTLLAGEFLGIPNLASFKLDLHLMVDDPLSYLASCQAINAARVIGQVEKMSDQKLFVEKTLNHTCQVGLAIDLPTALEKLEKKVLPQLDVVLVMSVKAGWGSQSFHPEVLQKVKKLAQAKKQKGLTFKIALDGGINLDNISDIAKAGAEIVYVGSAVQNNPRESLRQLYKAAKRYNS